jgi:hypothetical protein
MIMALPHRIDAKAVLANVAKCEAEAAAPAA